MSTTIYYFSGTGNSLKIAKDLCCLLKDSEVVRITGKLVAQEIPVHSEKIGIVFPVFAEGVPLLVENFVRQINVVPHQTTYVFAISNFGESSGCSLTQLKQLLAEKNLILADTFEIQMPDNFNVFYPPAPEAEQNTMIGIQEKMMAGIAKIVNEATFSPTLDDTDTQDSWQRPEFVPYEIDKKFWLNDQCNSCGTCEKVCAAGNIRIADNTPSWQHHCEFCLACMHWCPNQAIQFEDKTTQWGRYQCPTITLKDMVV
ncbi:EFR1 family ferrodoxin [Dehalobacter sp. DCM]|uniref:EFR1 family ferrodoxin n=1 Tax=Dehalobacter sp. DCM TaxID=2907827 RepID=UPI0030813C0F|nr:EFR1 family ferrodoxin [Dehalobacter sp. DCM]